MPINVRGFTVSAPADYDTDGPWLYYVGDDPEAVPHVFGATLHFPITRNLRPTVNSSLRGFTPNVAVLLKDVDGLNTGSNQAGPTSGFNGGFD